MWLGNTQTGQRRVTTLIGLGLGLGLDLLMLTLSYAQALERQPTRYPASNYVLYCAGCHGLSAQGVAHRIPNLHQSLPLLLSSKAGREFVLAVPGVAHSGLDDQHLLEVLNYLLSDINSESHHDFPAFTLAELQRKRSEPVQNVRQARAHILAATAAGAALIDY